MNWHTKTREVETRLTELIARTHPSKIPEQGEHLHSAFEKIADVIQDLQTQVAKLKLGVCVHDEAAIRRFGTKEPLE